MHRLVYSSVAAVALDAAHLDRLLGDSRTRNEADGLTGILLHVTTPDPDFAAYVQVLEGERRRVEDAYARIAADELHRDLALLASEPLTERAYADWTMRLAEVPAGDIVGPVGDRPYPALLAALRSRETVESLLARLTGE